MLHLIENYPLEYEAILLRLTNEELNIHDRLQQFKNEMRDIVTRHQLKAKNGKPYTSYANDERTAAAVLTCSYPQKYTFYKSRDLYEDLH